MKLYTKTEDYKLYHGSMLDMLEVIEPDSIESVVTDPPYELNFMCKGWDNAGVSFNKDTWSKCYKVLKPGGYLLAFGGSRTFHRIACAIEDAGFEIRDCIMWLYGTGFPKSSDIGNKLEEWKGWGTALKPAYEPIIVARKPFVGSLINNLIKNSIGALNIGACRIGNDKIVTNGKGSFSRIAMGATSEYSLNVENIGRFPSNVIHDGSKEVCAGFPITGKNGSIGKQYNAHNDIYGQRQTVEPFTAYQDNGSASRYFYCAKASTKDRDEGLSDFTMKQVTDGSIRSNTETARKFGANAELKRNTHPTVKPTELMQYLIRLVTPNGGTILDPFMGSGSTGKAAMYENKEHKSNYKFIGIEMTDEYLPIAAARISHLIDVNKTDAQQKMSAKDEQLRLF